MKRKILTSLLILAGLLGLASCGEETPDNKTPDIPTSGEQQTQPEQSDNYTVKVVYPDNTPVSGGVKVQWCTGDICLVPVKVNENGIAENDIDDDNYYIHISNIPSGYTYDPNAYTANADNKNIEIKLYALNELSGEGTSAAPYVVTNGAYNVTYAESSASGMKYYSFTPTEAGTYSIKSLATDKLAMNEIDPYIGFLGTSNDMNNIDISGNVDSKVNINFNYTFEAEAGVTYTFIVFVSSATTFPASFDIVILKA